MCVKEKKGLTIDMTILKKSSQLGILLYVHNLANTFNGYKHATSCSPNVCNNYAHFLDLKKNEITSFF